MSGDLIWGDDYIDLGVAGYLLNHEDELTVSAFTSSPDKDDIEPGKKNVFLMTCSFAISIMLFLSFQVMVVFLNQGMPALAPSAADVSITRGSTTLDRVLIEQIGELEGGDKVFGRMEAAGLSVSADAREGTITLVSYDNNQFGWAKAELNKGSITPAMENTDSVLVAYQDGVNWDVGDSVVLHTSSGDKQVTIAGILAAAAAGTGSGAGSSRYMICSEQTFAALAGDLGYTTIDIQFSAAGDDDTVSAIRGILPSDSVVSDQRITNSEAQSSYYTGAVFIYGFLIMIALITVFNIFNSMNASVASRTRQYGIMRSIGMGANQLCKMLAAAAIRHPSKQIGRMAVVETIKQQQ